MIKRTDVTVFVDWRSQISNAGQKANFDDSRRALITSEFVVKRIASFLQENGTSDIYNVEVRVYHGWHRGLTPTKNFIGLKDVIESRLVPLSIGNVTFDWGAPFGHTLLDAFEYRKHPRLRVHLPDTLREDLDQSGRDREKMVDTAMVCDVLQSARSDPKTWRIIMAEDDDLIPAAFVSEKWSKDHGGKTYILRTRPESRHVDLKGVLMNMEGTHA